MTSCRARVPGKRTAVVRALLAGLLAMLAATAAQAGSIQIAQTDSPRQLAPPVRLTPLPGSAASPPTDSETAPQRPSVSTRQTPQPPSALAPTEAPAPGGRARPGVDVVTLTAPDPASVGLIGQTEGGLGVSLWRGTKRALVETLLPRVPIKMSSRAARELAVRLLTSRAEAPGGPSNGANMLGLRVERLVALGEIVAASQLASLASVDQTDQGIARAAVEALFLHNDNAGACQRVRRHARQFKESYWQHARAFCLTLSGDRLRAGIVVDILRERGGNDTEVFFTLMEALAGGEEADVKSLPDPSGLDLAMMRAANARLPADVLSSDRPAVLRGVVDSPNADLELRLIAAERAYGYGAIDAETLGELYNAVPFDADSMAEPMTSAEADWGPRGRALLLRSARAAGDGKAKAELLRQAYDLAREKGGSDVLLGASVPLLKTMRPEPDLLWFARDAVLALLSAGDIDRARVWLDLAGADSDQAREAMTRLWGIGRFVVPPGAPPAVEPAPFTAWLHAVQANDTAEGREKAILLMSLLEAQGGSTEPGLWAGLLAAAGSAPRGTGPDIAWKNALAEAAGAGRLGETVLIALLGLVDSQDGRADAATVGAAIDGLRRVGLAQEAHALALEAAVANGL